MVMEPHTLYICPIGINYRLIANQRTTKEALEQLRERGLVDTAAWELLCVLATNYYDLETLTWFTALPSDQLKLLVYRLLSDGFLEMLECSTGLRLFHCSPACRVLLSEHQISSDTIAVSSEHVLSCLVVRTAMARFLKIVNHFYSSMLDASQGETYLERVDIRVYYDGMFRIRANEQELCFTCICVRSIHDRNGMFSRIRVLGDTCGGSLAPILLLCEDLTAAQSWLLTTAKLSERYPIYATFDAGWFATDPPFPLMRVERVNGSYAIAMVSIF